MKGWCLLLALMGPALAGCGAKEGGTPSWRTVGPDAVPWSVEVPADWSVSTMRTPPDPRLMTGILRTYFATTPYRFDLGRTHPGPNAGPGASAELGASAVVVFVQRLWFPADRPVEWEPPANARMEQARLGPWHDDAQNSGWRFRERRLCLGSVCVGVLEWHGPSASTEDVRLAEEIATSVRLDHTWTDGAVPA